MAITGSKDIQVDPKDLKRMSEFANTDFKYHEIPNVSHILRIEEGEPTPVVLYGHFSPITGVFQLYFTELLPNYRGISAQ